jgi:Rab GDP dissociation inhibitor
MMANGTLVRTLIHTDVTKYLSFKAVDGSYVFSKGKVPVLSLHSSLLGSIFPGFSHKWYLHSKYVAFWGFHQIHKVPATDMEALKSPLMGLFEKRRARNFFVYVQNYNEADPVTHQGLDLTRITTRELIS